MNMPIEQLIPVVLIYLVAYALDPLIWIMAFRKFLTPKYEKKIFSVLCFSGVYILILIKQWMVHFTTSKLTAFFFPIMVIYIFTVSRFLFEGNLKKRAGVFIAVYLLSVATDGMFTLVFLCFHISARYFAIFGIPGCILTLIVRVGNLIIFCTLMKLYNVIKQKNKINLYVIIICSFAFIISFVGVFVFSDTFSEDISLLYFIYVVQIILFLILTVFSITIIQEKTMKEMEAVHRAELSESKLSAMQYTKETLEEIKSIKHDVKRHCNYLMELNRRRDYQAIEKYLMEINDSLQVMNEQYLCDNLIISVALSSAQQKAKEQGIAFTKIITVNTFPFTDSELNSVITNILDNAFEAVSRITDGEKNIKLVIKAINDNELLIQCVNSYNKAAYVNIPLLSTIKQDKNNHGYGTKIVKAIVRRYKGTVHYWKDSKNFYVQIIVRGTE